MVHGSSSRGFAGEAQHRIDVLRRAIAGDPVAQAAAQYMGIPAGGDLTVTPHAPGLVDRLWYGAGSEATAVRTGQQGFDLQVSTLNTEETGEPFDVVQARQIRSYRKAFADAGHAGDATPAPRRVASCCRSCRRGTPTTTARSSRATRRA